MIPFRYLSAYKMIGLDIGFILLTVFALFLGILVWYSRVNHCYLWMSWMLFLVLFFLSQGFSDICSQILNGWGDNFFSRWVGTVPGIVYDLILVVAVGMEIILFFEVRKRKKQQISVDAMRKSLDYLPDGICFFREDGQPLLVNLQMNRLCGFLFESELLNGNWLVETFFGEKELKNGEIIRKEPDILVETWGDRIWNFQETEFLFHGEKISEWVASDVTEQLKLSRELEQHNERLMEMNRKLRIYSEEVKYITREQEILNAKIRVHDDVGRSLLAARAYLAGKKDKKDRASLMLLWKSTISILKKEAEPEKKSSSWEQLQKAAEAVQVKILLDGSLPEEEKARNIFITAMYECLTNTVKHADGTEVYISVMEDEFMIKMKATNNGNPPEKIVEETGGLSNLRRIVEKGNGKMMNDGSNGLDAAARIKKNNPETKIIAVTSMPEYSCLNRAREIGIESFWYKEASEETILTIMDRTMDGESVYPDAVPEVRLGHASSSEFTDRELEVLRLMTTGVSNAVIAKKLNIAENTVKNHIRHLMEKSGCRNRTELAIKARVSGIVISMD